MIQIICGEGFLDYQINGNFEQSKVVSNKFRLITLSGKNHTNKDTTLDSYRKPIDLGEEFYKKHILVDEQSKRIIIKSPEGMLGPKGLISFFLYVIDLNQLLNFEYSIYIRTISDEINLILRASVKQGILNNEQISFLNVELVEMEIRSEEMIISESGQIKQPNESSLTYPYFLSDEMLNYLIF